MSWDDRGRSPPPIQMEQVAYSPLQKLEYTKISLNSEATVKQEMLPNAASQCSEYVGMLPSTRNTISKQYISKLTARIGRVCAAVFFGNGGVTVKKKQFEHNN